MGAKTFSDLIVWQIAYKLSIRIHGLTESFPPEERYRLGDQMCRAASSIPMNIAEGFGRWSPLDQAHFYTIAKTSANELKVQLMHAKDLGYCKDTMEEATLADRVCAMLYRLRQKVLAKADGR
jgi:four helix bundle protein